MDRDLLVARAKGLAWFTLFYNIAEALVSGYYGWRAGALSLMGFGSDSLIEAGAAGIVLWRFKSVVADVDDEREASAQKWIAVLLMALGLYLAISAWFEFRRGGGPENGAPGIAISLVSLAVMYWLYRSKIKVSSALKSRALKADAFCALSCMWLSGLLLGGSLVLAGAHLLWFDSLTTLGMAFLIAREGVEEYDESCACGHP